MFPYYAKRTNIMKTKSNGAPNIVSPAYHQTMYNAIGEANNAVDLNHYQEYSPSESAV